MTSYDLIESRKQKNQVFNILNVERFMFSKHVMVSAGVCYGGKSMLHFIPDS